jgi:hypothetical protein
VVIVAIVVESGGDVAAAPVLAPVVRSYLRLFFALVLAGGASGVAVKAFYSPSAIDIAVALVSGAPAWVLSRRRVFRQLSEAGAPPTVQTEPRWATTRRLSIRVARLTALLAVFLVVIPLLLGASDDFLGNAAAIGAGALLSNGYACALLHLSARKWEQTHDRLILYEVRPHWSIRPPSSTSPRSSRPSRRKQPAGGAEVRREYGTGGAAHDVAGA